MERLFQRRERVARDHAEEQRQAEQLRDRLTLVRQSRRQAEAQALAEGNPVPADDELERLEAQVAAIGQRLEAFGGAIADGDAASDLRNLVTLCPRCHTSNRDAPHPAEAMSEARPALLLGLDRRLELLAHLGGPVEPLELDGAALRAGGVDVEASDPEQAAEKGLSQREVLNAREPRRLLPDGDEPVPHHDAPVGERVLPAHGLQQSQDEGHYGDHEHDRQDYGDGDAQDQQQDQHGDCERKTQGEDREAPLPGGTPRPDDVLVARHRANVSRCPTGRRMEKARRNRAAGPASFG